ncbi:unnamed protein product [Ostreobium quekettii]|uniref:Uncharacterized protein n=1 Tax=Ostreobium quekettii TaxID=121088 RepID=A0A8S1IXE3_9CHLO|nr:unnamed protein product [Ostreobium quekettii]|eukprot:evm.model.scf_612.6 EVM.evm.TU.scf_612.6   scf_612:51504-52417(-)
MGCDVQELRGVALAELPNHQLRFITYGSSQHAQWEGDWGAGESRAANADRLAEAGALSTPPAPPNLISAGVRVVQAPASYALPVTQKKPFRTPFKVRIPPPPSFADDPGPQQAVEGSPYGSGSFCVSGKCTRAVQAPAARCVRVTRRSGHRRSRHVSHNPPTPQRPSLLLTTSDRQRRQRAFLWGRMGRIDL